MTSSESMDAAAAVFGEGCAAVPKDGAGSFNGMATEPVATAASANPLLSTLVTAVKTAGLVDTLNSAPEITVFAPVNDAFAKIPAADLKKVLADKPTLTKILTNHVVAGKALAGPGSRATTRRSPAPRSRSRALARTSPSARPTPRSSAATSRPPTPRCTSSTAS